jgi:murein L,D-transpeptidase YcbB/YkuD
MLTFGGCSVYGRDTLKAVESFQLKNDLKADGVAGEKTLALLYSGNAKKK